MKKKMVLLIILISLFLGSVSCQRKPPTFVLNNSTVEDIEQIELLRALIPQDYSGWRVLYTLSKEEVPDFLSVFSCIKVNSNWNPQGHLGYLCVRITYTSGEQELFGSDAVKYLSSMGESTFDGFHSLYYDDLYNLFSKYVSETELPSF